jgi:hypothetical protein
MTENIILRRVLFHLVAFPGGGRSHIENPPPPPVADMDFSSLATSTRVPKSVS